MEHILEFCIAAVISNLLLILGTVVLGGCTYLLKRTLRRLPYTLTNTTHQQPYSVTLVTLITIALCTGVTAYLQLTTLTNPILAAYDSLVCVMIFALPGYFLYRYYLLRTSDIPKRLHWVALGLLYITGGFCVLTTLITYSHLSSTEQVITTATVIERGRYTGLSFAVTERTPQRVQLLITDPHTELRLPARGTVTKSEADAGTVPAYLITGQLGYSWYEVGIRHSKVQPKWFQ